MSLTHVILGWLNYEPMTGYDLNSLIEVSTQHFWSTSQSQIYRTLSKIEEEGWVVQEVILQETRPPRKVYHLTDTGRAELKQWISTFHTPDAPKIPWLIQVFFAGQISDEEILAVLEKKLASMKQRLGRIQAARTISAQSYAGDEDVRDIFFWTMTMDYGETLMEARIKWVEQTMVKIRNQEYKQISLEDHQRILEEKELINEKDETHFK
jgi:DNA-binding PadR family transcriptional regulator